MRIIFPYNQSDFPPVNVPDENLLGVFEPKACEPVADTRACVIDAIEHPTGCPTIEELARGKRTALIISDDYTRQTPVDVIIPILERKLKAAGIERIRVLVALGTHRAMTEQEKLARFGAGICARFEIIDHEYRNLDTLADMGTTARGTRFLVNKAALEADLVIGLGQIAPHRIAGFSGGSKIVLPGICGAEGIAHTHWIGGKEDSEKMLGFAENPVREEMNACAAMVGLRFIVNAICDPEGRLIGMVAGDMIQAHLAGCELAREVFGVSVPEQADIVIADSFPKDIELWQAAKALYAADLMVKPGGVVILVSPCVEGVSRAHPLILERGYTSEDQTLCEVESGQLTNLSVASHCLRVGRLIKDKAKGIMVRNGIGRADQQRLGFLSADSPQDALMQAFEIAGENATVAVLRHGGEALPVLGCHHLERGNL
jgi:nickel-dependent lactate racemase